MIETMPKTNHTAVIEQLIEDRSLPLRDRIAALAGGADSALLRAAVAGGLNRLETAIVLVLDAAERDEREPLDTVQIGRVLKSRTGDIAEQLEWLVRKHWVESVIPPAGPDVWVLTR